MRTLKNASFLTRLLSGFDQDWSTDDGGVPLRKLHSASRSTAGASQQPTAGEITGVPDSTDHELLAAIKQRLDFLDSCDFEPWRAATARQQPGQAEEDAPSLHPWSDTTRAIRS